jgi:uncharacterized protein
MNDGEILMESIIIKKEFNVTGMSCASCSMKIEDALKDEKGIKSIYASYADATVVVEYEKKSMTIEKIAKIIEEAGYKLSDESGMHLSEQVNIKKNKGKSNTTAVIGILIIAVALYFIMNSTGGFNFLPEINQSMGYGILFVVGLMTSIHCIAMCGGINLSQSISRDTSEKKVKTKIMPAVLYNIGRVISYTLIGGIVGALGSVISFSSTARGVVAIIAGVFMIIMGLSMMNVFPWLRKLIPRMPRSLSAKVHGAKKGKGPLIVGLLNGFMPCGPLQAMQIYALGTGSFIAGAFSMFMFSLGTVPLMLGFGAISSILSSKFTKKLMWVSAALVMILGVVMMGRGFNQSGISIASASSNKGNIAVTEENIQYITTDMEPNYYEPFVVQAGITVKWTINVEEGDLNGCNNPITIPKFGIEKVLTIGENIIEFTPEKEGNILYTCWMGMIDGNISVVSDIANADKKIESFKNEDASDSIKSESYPKAVDYESKSSQKTTKEISVAKINDGIQTITVNVNEYGFSTSIIVLEKDIETQWIINGEKLDYCNNSLIFPSYGAKLDLSEGENIIDFVPTEDFNYSCWMGMINGYVEVVEDIDNIDLELIKTKASETISQTEGGCCG